MPGNHARLAPSASKRWMSCTASPLYVEALTANGTIIGDKESVWSIEGTQAHDWAAAVLRGEITLDQVPEDFRPHILEYVHVCHECERGAGKESLRMVEQKVPLFYDTEETGTMDYGFLRVDKKGKLESLHIRDLKYGAGVPVDAEENTQLAIYAFSWIMELETWWGNVPGHIPVSIGIHQPRYTGDDSLKLWDISVGDLAAFCGPITHKATMIRDAGSIEELEFAPDAETCRFCPAKAICKARLEASFMDFPQFEQISAMELFAPPAFETVPLETLVAIWSRRKDITSWLDGAHDYLESLATAGNKAPGTKLVAGREGNRKWVEGAEAWLEAHLADGAWKEREPISPATAEKLLKEHLSKEALKTHMEKLTERAEGRLSLAPENDKRPEVLPAVSMFTLITDEEEAV